jgi:hypothetical protein
MIIMQFILIQEILVEELFEYNLTWNIEGIIWESKIYAVINSGSIITRY